MRHWLCCDGGGTKLVALLIDEDLRIVKSAAGGGVNPNFLSAKCVRAHLRGCIEAAVAGYESSISGCFASMPAPSDMINEALGAAGVHRSVEMVGEGAMGLLAGVGSRWGLVALSGTGSAAIYEGPDASRTVGGLGLYLGDEGSGTHIGQMGLIAAIHAIDDRGEDTLLKGEMRDWLGAEDGADGARLISMVCDKVYCAPSRREALASFAPRVSRVVARGDRVAEGILIRAGEEMAAQMTALIRGLGRAAEGLKDQPSTVCGGAWKGHRLMYRTYRDAMGGAYPHLRVSWPRYDAVAGGAVLLGLRLGYAPGEVFARMEDTFSHLRFAPEPETEQ